MRKVESLYVSDGGHRGYGLRVGCIREREKVWNLGLCGSVCPGSGMCGFAV